jgi:hypothetical protein
MCRTLLENNRKHGEGKNSWTLSFRQVELPIVDLILGKIMTLFRSILRRESESSVKVANDRDILPDLTGYSSGLFHYLNPRFQLNLLAITSSVSFSSKISSWMFLTCCIVELICSEMFSCQVSGLMKVSGNPIFHFTILTLEMGLDFAVTHFENDFQPHGPTPATVIGSVQSLLLNRRLLFRLLR